MVTNLYFTSPRGRIMGLSKPLATVVSTRLLSPLRIAESVPLQRLGVKSSLDELGRGMVSPTFFTSHVPSPLYYSFLSSYSSPLLLAAQALLVPFFFIFYWLEVSLTMLHLLGGLTPLSSSLLIFFMGDLQCGYPFHYLDN